MAGVMCYMCVRKGVKMMEHDGACSCHHHHHHFHLHPHDSVLRREKIKKRKKREKRKAIFIAVDFVWEEGLPPRSPSLSPFFSLSLSCEFYPLNRRDVAPFA